MAVWLGGGAVAAGGGGMAAGNALLAMAGPIGKTLNSLGNWSNITNNPSLKLTKLTRRLLLILLPKYERLGNLSEAAFDPNLNLELRLQASIKLAEAYGVPDSNIIHNVDELDFFMLS